MLKNILLVMCACLMGACTAKGEVRDSAKKRESLLFVIHAKSGEYSQGKLTMKNVNKTATYFTDRPNRRAGKSSIQNLVSLWEKGKSFDVNPPNAGAVFFDRDDKGYGDIPIEISNPRYDMSRDQLTFDVKVLEGKSLPEHGELHEITLFIDRLLLDQWTDPRQHNYDQQFGI